MDLFRHGGCLPDAHPAYKAPPPFASINAWRILRGVEDATSVTTETVLAFGTK